jgi:hypothetical protein
LCCELGWEVDVVALLTPRRRQHPPCLAQLDSARLAAEVDTYRVNFERRVVGGDCAEVPDGLVGVVDEDPLLHQRRAHMTSRLSLSLSARLPGLLHYGFHELCEDEAGAFKNKTGVKRGVLQ